MIVAIWSLDFRFPLQPGHGAKENDQDTDGDERQWRASEKFRRPIETLATAGLHERDERQHEPHGVTDQRNGESRRWSPPEPGSGRSAQKPEPEKEKRRQPEFAQVVHSAPAYAMLPIAATSRIRKRLLNIGKKLLKTWRDPSHANT
jgi:hypothetical protein